MVYLVYIWLLFCANVKNSEKVVKYRGQENNLIWIENDLKSRFIVVLRPLFLRIRLT